MAATIGFLFVCLLTFVRSQNAAPNCFNVSFQVSATASNLAFPPDFNLSTLISDNYTSVVTTLPRTKVSGKYTIAGTYCEPSNVVQSRHSTLQLLVHGVGYDRYYWGQANATGAAKTYSWTEYASQEGYPTLAIDRLCNGASSKPNGLLVCQSHMNTQSLHEIIADVRRGSVVPRSFNKVIFASHSLGSGIGNELGQMYPADIDAYILTGYSPLLAIGFSAFVAASKYLPAQLVDPAKHPNLDPTYLLAGSESGQTGCFYFGDFDLTFAAQDYASRGAVPLGESASLLLGELPAPAYTGPVLVLNGEEDQIFCARLPTDPLVGYRGNCGEDDTSYTAQTKRLYPNARSFQYSNTEQTGHDVNLHKTAQTSFKVAHDFLAESGF